MTNTIPPAFDPQLIKLLLEQLLPTRRLPEGLKRSDTYKKVLASIRVVGVLEPLRVYPDKGGKYLLLDGHVRVEALRELGIADALCLVATTAENSTGGRHVCQVPPIQGQRMIEKAVSAGVSAETIAEALNRSAKTMHRQRSLLRGICPEALELLKDKPVSLETIALLQKVKPMRQIEMADLMATAGTYSASYARGLFVTTQKDQLVDPEKPKKLRGVKPEDLARLEHELQAIEQSYRLLDVTYNENLMLLTIARGYLRELLKNPRVVRYLGQKHREVLAEFQRIVKSTTLEA